MPTSDLRKKPKSFHPWFPLLLIIAILAFILLYFGFKQLNLSNANAMYAAANLLLNSEYIEPDKLEQQRNGFIISGQVAGYIAFYGILIHLAWLILGEGMRLAYVRWFYKNHTIVTNLNKQGKAFITNMLKSDNKQKIVALLEQVESEHIAYCQARGIRLVTDDATHNTGLYLAAIKRAKKIIICGSLSDSNLRIAEAVQGTLNSRHSRFKQLDLYVSISSSMLSDGLGNENYKHFLQPTEKINPYTYSIESLVARLYFNLHPPHTWADQHGQTQVHLIFIGDGPLMEAMMKQYAQISPYKRFTPPIFTILGSKATQQSARIQTIYPALANNREGAEQVIEGLHAFDCDECFTLTEEDFIKIAEPDGKKAPPTAVIFCDIDDEKNYLLAIHLHQQTLRYNRWRVPFHLYLCRSEGIQALLNSAISKHQADQIIPFGMAEQLFSLHQFIEVEQNAKHIHQSYCQPDESDNQTKNEKVHSWRSLYLIVRKLFGADAETNSNINLMADNSKPWEYLSETYRASNRRAGDHMSVKLAGIECHLEAGKSLILEDSIKLDQPDERREQLSRLEHRSWRYERLLTGWRYASSRNDRQRTHPSIVLWDDLPEDERKKDVKQIESVRKALKRDLKDHPVTVRQELTIGLIGHNYLSVKQADYITQKLRTEVLPTIYKDHENHFITLLTPLAPGSDFILARESIAWLTENKIPHRLLIAQAIKLDKVVADYKHAWDKAGSWNGETNAAVSSISKLDWKEARKEIELELQDFINSTESCESIIDLTLEGTTNTERNSVAYRRAGKWIQDKSDALIAVFDSARGEGGPGGTMDSIKSWEMSRHKNTLKVINLKDI